VVLLGKYYDPQCHNLQKSQGLVKKIIDENMKETYVHNDCKTYNQTSSSPRQAFLGQK
jgi:hypothetical protein